MGTREVCRGTTYPPPSLPPGPGGTSLCSMVSPLIDQEVPLCAAWPLLIDQEVPLWAAWLSLHRLGGTSLGSMALFPGSILVYMPPGYHRVYTRKVGSWVSERASTLINRSSRTDRKDQKRQFCLVP